ncbi:heat shock 70 kDa protein 12B-like isoform X2 [Mizuhopecten yessoensis]|nr:heat shock 70 kDa protein 12B-like isoform X2 [Mizuhopecten yessoensis]
MADAKKKSACPNLFVAAIDFGTTYSGYAFSGKDDFEKDPLKISANHWNAGARSLISHKAPTCLLLKPDKTFQSFGYKAENDFTLLAEDNDDDDDDDDDDEEKVKEDFKTYYYFHRFKMILHNNKDLSRSTQIEDETGKSLPAVEVFTHSIRYLKDHLFTSLVDSFNGITEQDIKYVVTVPAIWNDNAKQFMRLAATLAGISADNLSIALEPEAASLYCQHHSIVGEDGEKELLKKTARSGDAYMVVDLGGGTADITVHEKQIDGSLKELLAATGGAFGGKNVDDAFKSFLEDIVGKDIMKKFKNNCMEDYIDIFREFETKKRSVTEDSVSKVSMTMPVTLSDLVKRSSTKGKKVILKEVVENSKYGNEVGFAKQKIHISHAQFVQLFKPTVDGILKHMEGILYQSNFCHVKNILMVGGFSECELLQNAIKNRLTQKRIIIPEDAGLAVLKGAVLFGHIPRAISGRVARYTYGIQSWPMFNDRCHPESKRVMVGSTARCRDVFFKFIEIGQQVTPGHREAQVFQVLNPAENSLECTVFASTERDPAFVDDASCSQLGILTVPFSRPANSTRAVEIEETLIFGETELRVKAKDLATGQEFEASLNLL